MRIDGVSTQLTFLYDDDAGKCPRGFHECLLPCFECTIRNGSKLEPDCEDVTDEIIVKRILCIYQCPHFIIEDALQCECGLVIKGTPNQSKGEQSYAVGKSLRDSLC